MTLLSALDRALDAVERAERRRLRTRAGDPADPELARLRTRLITARDRARHGDPLNLETLGEMIREVAAWTPDTELHMLAALGAVAQAARAGPQE